MNALWKKLIGRLAAEVCYYIGHWSWLVFEAFCKEESYDEEANRFTWPLEWLWNIYQHSMSASYTVQEWGGAEKPWVAVDVEGDQHEAEVH